MPSGNSGKLSSDSPITAQPTRVIRRGDATRIPVDDRDRLVPARPARARQPALRAALARHDEVVPVFCLDDRLLHGRHASGPRTQFMLECLADLDASLRERGGRLVVRRGRPEEELPRLARRRRDAYYVTRDVSPFARRRRAGCLDAALRAAHPGCPATTWATSRRRQRSRTRSSRPSTAPGSRTPAARGAARAAPGRGCPTGIDAGAMPTARATSASSRRSRSRCTAARREGRRRLTNFLRGPVERYESEPRRPRTRTAPRGSRPTSTSAASRRARSSRG